VSIDVTRLRAFLDQAREALAAEQRGCEREIEAARALAEREEQRGTWIHDRLAALDRELARYSREDLRQLFQTAKDREVRAVALRARLEALTAQQALLVQQAAVLTQLSALLDTDAGGAVPAVAVHDLLTRQDARRQRLALQLHDEVAQPLHQLALQTELLPRVVGGAARQGMDEIERLRQTAGRILHAVRAVMFDLHPMSLTDLGLLPTLARYLRLRAERDGVVVHMRTVGRARELAPGRVTPLFRMIEDMLDCLHEATTGAGIDLLLAFEGDELVIAATTARPPATEHLAAASARVAALEARAQGLAGQVEIVIRPSEAARVQLRVPLSPTDARDTGGVKSMPY
jgi:two-component system sensor histidine kinase DegS